jgi:hypothetical protein
MPMELILNYKKKYVSFLHVFDLKKPFHKILDHIISNCVYQIITWPILIPAGHGGRSNAAITGSNPAANMDACLLCCVSSGVCDGFISVSEES